MQKMRVQAPLLALGCIEGTRHLRRSSGLIDQVKAIPGRSLAFARPGGYTGSIEQVSDLNTPFL